MSIQFTIEQKARLFDEAVAAGKIVLLADFSSTLASEVQALTQFTEPSYVVWLKGA